MTDTKLIIGLGNPGADYVGTRHNIGFELLDRLADVLSITFGTGKGPYAEGKGSYKGKNIILMKPLTYMNRSGQATASAVNWYKLQPADCLVCHDDINLPAGTIRLKSKGSAGGHNGLADIIQSLQTDLIPRLRIGVGNDFRRGRQSDYVLSRFKPIEEAPMEEALTTAVEAVLDFIRDGADIAMNRHN